ncbi:hypothetical protein EON82_08690 [bacterium]|nr:MAG: hypothetical protein EON82_08690 [bacterium]
MPLAISLVALLVSAQTITVPKITASVDLSAGRNRPPVEVDAATKAKLDDLAKTYERVARENYPLIIRALRLENDPTPKDVRIVVTYAYNGVAATGNSGFGGENTGARISVSAKYALDHPNDLGMIVHEMVHVVQSYPNYDPVWLVEGVADWVRWFNYEALNKRPRPNPARATARDSYQTTGAFLYWASTHYDINLVPKLNRAFKTRTYKEELFKEYTGKTLTELDAEWRKTLR